MNVSISQCSLWNDEPQKRCPRCEQYHPATLEFFHRRRASRDGLHSLCKTCNCARVSAYKKAKRKAKPPKQPKTHCPHGHPLIEGNLRRGKRECLTCHRERERIRSGSKPGPKRRPKKNGFCVNGHALVKSNLRTGKHAGECLTCHRESEKRRYHKNPRKMVAQATHYAKTHREQINIRFRGYRRQEEWRVRAKASNMRRRANRTPLHTHRFYNDQQAHTHLASLSKDPCCYCGKPMQHIDHIVPVAKSGAEHWTNLTAACQRCNSRKRDRSLLDFLIYRLEHPDP